MLDPSPALSSLFSARWFLVEVFSSFLSETISWQLWVSFHWASLENLPQAIAACRLTLSTCLSRFKLCIWRPEVSSYVWGVAFIFIQLTQRTLLSSPRSSPLSSLPFPSSAPPPPLPSTLTFYQLCFLELLSYHLTGSLGKSVNCIRYLVYSLFRDKISFRNAKYWSAAPTNVSRIGSFDRLLWSTDFTVKLQELLVWWIPTMAYVKI